MTNMTPKALSREIKFRAWDKLNKHMIGVVILDMTTAGDTKVHYLRSSGYRLSDMKNFLFNVDNVVLMQYTGLEDKNGKEIWEGDITEMGVIEFRVGGFMVGSSPLNWNSIELEIIGNIYENPELLN